jgi:uncharacterized repeat protein (TIGR01451 family)
MPPTGSGLSFQTAYSSEGEKLVTVSTTGYPSGTCKVKVEKPEEPKVCKLEIEKFVSTPEAEYRSEGKFTIRVKNRGDGTCKNVHVTDDLDDSFKFLRQQATGIAYLSNIPELTPGPVLEWAGNIEPNTAAYMDIIVQIRGAAGQKYPNVAVARADNAPQVTSNMVHILVKGEPREKP